MDTPIHLDRIDPELILRFGAAVEEVWPADTREGPLGLAVSGGPDSLALLLLGRAALPEGVTVLSVDHGLRPEAAGEVAFVHGICTALGVPFASAKVTLGAGNLQARAREARYRALAQWAAEREPGAVATAHHADDQAETLLMRLARGSGLAGLAGVRAATRLPTGPDGTAVSLIRPLLGFRKAELEAIVASAGLTPVRDPSNRDPAFDRVRVREALAGNDWLDAQALATSAQHLAEGWRALEWYAEIDWEEMVEREGEAGFRYYCNVPRAVQVETVRRIVAELGGIVSRSEAGRAADRLWRGENASLGGVLATCDVEMVEPLGVEMRVWRFSPEPPRRTH